MAKKDYTVSMKNAEASIRMEGYTVTPRWVGVSLNKDGNLLLPSCARRFFPFYIYFND